MESGEYDVAIIGGGPAGSSTGTLLKRYCPSLRVLILERERFPREHVGESLLPGACVILDEMACWDKVEAANFPIKIGATYKWGKTTELWDFDFMPHALIKAIPRPGKFEGQRRSLAFQVDRAIYDEILLDHAESLGCEVRQETRVLSVQSEGDRVSGLRLESGEEITARYYVDASGHSGILRRAMGVESTYPTALQNVAIWDYWQNASWAEEIGIEGTRVQVMSLGYGWVWFIPLGPTRTSVGLVIPKTTFKEMAQPAEAVYAKAILEDARIRGLMEGAVSEGKLQTTRDWSFEAARHCGQNWFLAGESSGFADPILAAGLTITHSSAREAAFTILSMDEQDADKDWLRREYDLRQGKRIRSHIRFADYWYTANTQFKDLQEFTAQIAKESGLDLKPEEAWRWLAQGGFIQDELSLGFAGFHFSQLKDLKDHMGDLPDTRPFESKNVFTLLVKGAVNDELADYDRGSVKKTKCLKRNGKVWPLTGPHGIWYRVLQSCRSTPEILRGLGAALPKIDDPNRLTTEMFQIETALNVLIEDGWVEAGFDARYPLLNSMNYLPTIHWHEAGK
jgi:flavin-dependent dehydrogenase